MPLTAYEPDKAAAPRAVLSPGLSASIGCLTVAVAGTNGKGTTARMIETLLRSNERKSLVAEASPQQLESIIRRTRELDFLILKLDALQIEALAPLRPTVAVLMNTAPDRFEFFSSEEQYVRALAGLFQHQETFDWAVVQREALLQVQQIGVPIKAKVVTFSSLDPEADLYLDRGLLISRLPNWSGPLLNMDYCQVRGPHNAENLMAALAVGHVLRLPLDRMLEPLKTFTAGRHRFEFIGEFDGVQFIDDSKARNPDALKKAILAARPSLAGEPNVVLIAGGDDTKLEYHDLGPLLSRRVKHVFLTGSASEKLRAAWSLFTPCTVIPSLVEAVAQAAKSAASGDVVLLSPACSKFDGFQSYENGGEIFCQSVKSISRGALSRTPNINGSLRKTAQAAPAVAGI